jgi:hypothetical protein
MVAPALVFTLRYVASLLNVPEVLVEEIAITMVPQDGCLSIIDSADEAGPSTFAFTRDGIEHVKILIQLRRNQ